MRENRTSGSEGGAMQTNASSLPLSLRATLLPKPDHQDDHGDNGKCFVNSGEGILRSRSGNSEFLIVDILLGGPVRKVFSSHHGLDLFWSHFLSEIIAIHASSQATFGHSAF